MKPTNLMSQKYEILVITKLLKYQSKLVSNVESKEMASLRISKLYKLVFSKSISHNKASKCLTKEN